MDFRADVGFREDLCEKSVVFTSFSFTISNPLDPIRISILFGAEWEKKGAKKPQKNLPLPPKKERIIYI